PEDSTGGHQKMQITMQQPATKLREFILAPLESHGAGYRLLGLSVNLQALEINCSRGAKVCASARMLSTDMSWTKAFRLCGWPSSLGGGQGQIVFRRRAHNPAGGG